MLAHDLVAVVPRHARHAVAVGAEVWVAGHEGRERRDVDVGDVVDVHGYGGEAVRVVRPERDDHGDVVGPCVWKGVLGQW